MSGGVIFSEVVDRGEHDGGRVEHRLQFKVIIECPEGDVEQAEAAHFWSSLERLELETKM